VEWILHTHFHRDQTQGDSLAKAQGIKIAVAAGERKYFERVEDFWDEKKVFDLYNMRNEFQTLRENMTVDQALKPGDRIFLEAGRPCSREYTRPYARFYFLLV